MADYEHIGTTYSATRATDPRIAAAIERALGSARSVVNVGAGTGSYEPAGRRVVAVEPSEVMRAQRPLAAAPALRAWAEALPFSDGEFDAAMAVLSDHHWSDQRGGLAELRRVARDTVVVFTWDRTTVEDCWLVDYLPGYRRLATGGMDVAEVAECLGGASIEAVPVPHDCRDGFMHAFWRRPEAYLDPAVRDGISVFARLDPEALETAMARLRTDLESGAWARRNADILAREQLDVGYRLIRADVRD